MANRKTLHEFVRRYCEGFYDSDPRVQKFLDKDPELRSRMDILKQADYEAEKGAAKLRATNPDFKKGQDDYRARGWMKHI